METEEQQNNLFEKRELIYFILCVLICVLILHLIIKFLLFKIT